MSLLENLSFMATSPLMQRALVVALVVGLCTPVIGTYLVQRRLSLLGDGIGHVALTGVALGWLVGAWWGLDPADVLAVPGAVLASIAGAVLIELVRSSGSTSGDVALAMLFYGGIAGGVLIIGLAGGTTTRLNGYLFGSISTVTTLDVWLTVGLGILLLAVGLGLRPALFALSYDEEFARASGLPVRALNILISVMAALTISVAMRVVGVLLVSAVMIVPVAAAQQVTRSFRRTMALAMGIGVLVSVTGLTVTYFVNLSPGAMIVVLALGAYLTAACVRAVRRRVRGNHAHDPHPEFEDDVVLRRGAGSHAADGYGGSGPRLAASKEQS